MNKNSGQRIQSIDMAKGFAMLCIIAGHLGPSGVKPFVFSFHVPIFYLLGGYFLNREKSWKEYIRAKGRRLLVPYAVTCLLIIAGTTAREIFHSRSLGQVLPNVKMWLAASLYGSGTIELTEPFYVRQIGAIWFLPALFVGLAIVKFFIRYERGYIGILVCAYVGYKTTDMFWLPLSIQAGMAAAFFIWLGYLAGQEKVLEIRPHAAIVAGLAGIWLICIRFSGRVYMVRNYFENGLLDVLGAVAGSYLVVLASGQAAKKLRFLSGGMAFIGRNSLLILCCHAFDMVAFSWEGVRQFLEGRCGAPAGTWMLLAVRILAYIIVTGIILAVRKVCERKDNMDAGKRPAL